MPYVPRDSFGNDFAREWGLHPWAFAVEQCVMCSLNRYGKKSLLHCTLQCYCSAVIFVQMISNCDMPAAGLTAGLTPKSFSRALL